MRPTRAEWALLALALVLRLWLVSNATWLPVSDTRDYHDLARSLVSGQGYLQLYKGERPEYWGIEFQAFRMPGYPALLAGLYSLFGWDPMVGYAANVACDLATQILLLALGRQLLGPAAGMAAQALFATHVVWTPSLMTESVFTLLFTALVLLLVRGRAAASPLGAAGFGLLLTIALFVRPIAVAVLPVALARTARARSAARCATLAALMLVPLVLGLGAWAARNHQRLGSVVVLTTNLGAHNAPSFGLDRARIVEEGRGQGLNEAGINDALVAEIGRTVAASPAWAAWLYARRALDLFSLGRPWEVRALLATRTFAAPDGLSGAHLAYGWLLFQYYLTYPLALAGALLLARERRPLYGVWAILGIYVLAHAVVSDGNFRLAAPLYPLLCLFAGHTLAWLGAQRGWLTEIRPRTHPGESAPLPAWSVAAGPGDGSAGPAGPRAAAPGSTPRAPWAVRVILASLGIVVFGLGAALLGPAVFHWIFVSEFGPVELGTAACFGAAAVLALGLATQSRRVVPGGFRVLYTLFALGALFAGLEEISYGQHFFGWHSPRWFAEQNAQNETNLHNLLGDRPGKALRNVALGAVAVGGIVLPAATMWVGGQFAPGRWAYYLLPRGELIPLVAATLLMRLFRTLPRGTRAGWDLGLYEVLELYLAIAALLYVLLLRRRLLSTALPTDRDS